MQAQVYKIHSDFYYVKNSKHERFVCKIKETLKKQKADVRVGDFVELSQDLNFISKLLKRKNFIERPAVANIDLALVVCAIKEPELDFIQLNRYLTYLKYFKIDCAICFNKEDLDYNLSKTRENIENVYKKLGYRIFFTSAKNKLGLDDLKIFIKNKTIVLTGASGAGKSTLLNALNPFVNLKTREVSKKTQRGVHTTRHCEIIECDDFDVIDTPGFSNLKFDFILPFELINLFDDLKQFKGGCKYSNCLHNVKSENLCSIYDNLDKIDSSRYESYLEFLNECLEYKEKISKRSIKSEQSSKKSGSIVVTKISKGKRMPARNTAKQRIKKEEN